MCDRARRHSDPTTNCGEALLLTVESRQGATLTRFMAIQLTAPPHVACGGFGRHPHGIGDHLAGPRLR